MVYPFIRKAIEQLLPCCTTLYQISVPVGPTVCASHTIYYFSGSTFQDIVFGDIKYTL